MAGFGLQLQSLDLLKSRKEFSSALQAAMKEPSETVWITDRWWVGHAVWSHFNSRSVYLVRSPSDWEQLQGKLTEQGVESTLWITRPGEQTPPSAASIRTPGMDYYSLCWYPIRLRTER